MSQRLIVLDEAEEELIEAEKWYEKQRAGLGQEFLAAIGEGERILKASLAASPIVNIPAIIGTRRVFVRRFPYSIIFVEHGEDLWLLRLPTSVESPAIGGSDWNGSLANREWYFCSRSG